jgi:hypothetical protein
VAVLALNAIDQVFFIHACPFWSLMIIVTSGPYRSRGSGRSVLYGQTSRLMGQKIDAI